MSKEELVKLIRAFLDENRHQWYGQRQSIDEQIEDSPYAMLDLFTDYLENSKQP